MKWFFALACQHFCKQKKKLCYIFVTDISSSCTLSLSLSLSDFSLIFSCSAAVTFCIISGWASTHFWKRSCNYHEKNSEKQTDWKRDRQTNRQINWQTDFVTERLTQWLTDCLINSQRDWLNDRMNEWMTSCTEKQTDKGRKKTTEEKNWKVKPEGKEWMNEKEN